MLAEAFAEGAHEAGHAAELVDLNDVMSGLLRDCRSCRQPDGSCSIDDGYAELVHGRLLPADAWIYATPLYYYGMAASLKNFFDRLVCYGSGSYPRHQEVADGMRGKRSALLLSAEESNQAAGLPVTNQIQEVSRYLHHQFVGVVTGIGNKRGEVRCDPAGPLEGARRLGGRLFEAHHSDYNMDSERSNAVWPQARSADEASGIYEDV
jgi:multimeric flavodoxin WrbA